jgi:formate hydrogenlyase subunit 3/multisubunit Na+/H+ antiporter MnhD subunit
LRFVGRVLFCAGAVVGLVLAVVALFAIPQPPQSTVLPLGLPDLPFHLRLDSLSAFFLLLLGAAGAAISSFSAGYPLGEGTAPGPVLRVPRLSRRDGAGVGRDGAYLFMVA